MVNSTSTKVQIWKLRTRQTINMALFDLRHLPPDVGGYSIRELPTDENDDNFVMDLLSKGKLELDIAGIPTLPTRKSVLIDKAGTIVFDLSRWIAEFIVIPPNEYQLVLIDNPVNPAWGSWFKLTVGNREMGISTACLQDRQKKAFFLLHKERESICQLSSFPPLSSSFKK